MSGNGISITGLGSGLDTTKIIQQLVALEKLPINALEDKKASVQSKISTLGTFKGLVKDLQTKAKLLSVKKDFLEYDVTPSEEGVATFSASGSATAGNHTLKVTSLASVDRWAFDGVASRTADLATAASQQISFDVDGTNYSLTVQQDQSSLDEIAAEINTLAGDDVTASVVNTSTSGSPSYKLVLTANESGEDNRISNIVSTVGGLTIDWVAPDGQGAAQSTDNITVGSNAVAEIDGLLVERETNEFGDVLAGISITATAADPNKTITFTVEADHTAIKKKVKEFVDSYNKVISFVNAQSTYTEDAGAGGVLFGDPILRDVKSSIDTALFGVDLGTVTADTQGYSTLSLVGIKKQSDGTLTVNDSDLEDKLTNDINALADLFVDTDGFDNGGALENTPGYYTDTTTDSGLAASLERTITRMFATTRVDDDLVLKGVFDNRSDTYARDLLRYNKQIDAKTEYLDKFEQSLVLRFAKLEELIGGLNAQGASLSAAMSGLG
ncbi:MAG: flagellar filament capping protein FliD [Planctomycetes bacterium]|nr:flagellar filament capping protein FliD [Planctomycetota bacterium]